LVIRAQHVDQCIAGVICATFVTLLLPIKNLLEYPFPWQEGNQRDGSGTISFTSMFWKRGEDYEKTDVKKERANGGRPTPVNPRRKWITVETAARLSEHNNKVTQQ
jgi:hypothetical protein